MAERQRLPLSIELTDEQVRLYHTSPIFKAGVEHLEELAKTYIAGLEVRAVRMDAEHRARMREVMTADAWPVPPLT